MNARPGLNIQIANRCGLSQRIRRVDESYDQKADAAKRVRFSRREFGAERQVILPLKGTV